MLACLLGCVARAHAAGAVSPQLTELLGMIPDSVTVTAAIPALGRLERRAIKLTETTLPEFDPAAMRDKAVQNVASALGLDGPTTVAGLARGLGIEPDEPLAMYFDLSPMQERAQRASEIARTPMPWWHREPKDTSPDPTARTWVKAALVAHCKDPELTWQRLLLICRMLGIPDFESDLDTPGLPLFENTLAAYAFVDGRFFLANDAGLIRALWQQVQSPTPVRYGTSACPAAHPDDVVILTRLDKLGSLAPKPGPFYLALGTDQRLLSESLEIWSSSIEGLFTSPDPCVTTISIQADSIAYASRIALDAHTRYGEKLGQAQPAKLLHSLPSKANAVGQVNLTPELKQKLHNGIVGLLRIDDETDASEPIPLLDTADAIAIGLYAPAGSSPTIGLLIQSVDVEALHSDIRNTFPSASIATSSEEIREAFEAQSSEDGALGILLLKHGAAIATTPELLEQLAVATTIPTALDEARDFVWKDFEGAVSVVAMDTHAIQIVPDFFGMEISPFEESAASSLRTYLSRITSFQAGNGIESGWQRIFLSLSFK